MLKKILSITTIFLSLCLVTVDAATPKYSADKAVLAYAELYAFGNTENIEATGMPKETSDKVKENVDKYSMLPFYNYPLNKENFAKVKTNLAEKIHEGIKISTRLKVDDPENPVVEVTANHINQNKIDELKSNNANFVTLDIMKHISTPVELATDGKFQNVALSSLLGIIAELPFTESTTLEVTCKLIEYEGNGYWMPQDLKALSGFVTPVFELKETDPELIDSMLIQIFGSAAPTEESAKTEENSTEE